MTQPAANRQVFIAATRQNDGKTMVSLGLFHALKKRFDSVAYMKPVGQQYKIIDQKKIDKDAILFRDVYQLSEPLPLMSPIAVPSGFTENYIQNPNLNELQDRLIKSKNELVKDKSFFLCEGTGHAGVGSVFDLSNASVAKLFNISVILVSLGGIGRTIDEIMLNKAVFDQMGVHLAGVIINKVTKDKYDKVDPIIRQGLARHNIPVLGVIPFVDMLIKPSITTIFESLNGTVLSKTTVGFLRRVEKCLIGDMVPHDALNALSTNTLLIIPANREGLIMTALCGNLLDNHASNYVSGIIFTGGKKPHGRVLDFIEQINIPTMVVDMDSFSVATKINQMIIKVHSEENEKIEKAQELIEQYVDIDYLCEQLK